MDSDKAANMRYGRTGVLFIDLRLQFGWRGSLGCRQLDPAGTAAFRKGQIGVGDIDKYMRGLREGGVGVGIGAASSATEQAAPEWTGRGG